MKNGKIKVGSIVKALAGPHKGQDHEVIAIKDGGYNITPVNRKNVKYKLGAVKASEKQIELVKEMTEETLSESTELYAKKGVVITRWNMGFDSPLKGRNTAFQIGAGTLGKRSVRDNYVHLTAAQMEQLVKDLKSLKLNEDTDISEAGKINYPFAWGYLDSVMKDFIPLAKREKLKLDPAQLKEVQKFIDKLRKEAYVKAEKAYKDFKRNEDIEVDEDAELNEGLRHIKTASFQKGSKLVNDIMTHFKPGSRLNKELNDASDGDLNKKYGDVYKHLRAAAEIFEDLEADVKMVESVDLEENAEVDRITKLALSMKVGDKTNFGVIKKMGKDYISVKAKDTPETKLKFNQRKSGGRYVLSLLSLMEEIKPQADMLKPFTSSHTDDMYKAAQSILNKNNHDNS